MVGKMSSWGTTSLYIPDDGLEAGLEFSCQGG